jgi:hypothetical protein
LLLFTIPALAQEYPKAEIFGGYSYVRADIPTIPLSILAERGANFNGGSGSVAYNPSPWVGLLGDVGVYHHGTRLGSTNIVTYLFGPRLSFRKSSRVTPYGQFVMGGTHMSIDTASSTSFTLVMGGGLDAGISPRVAVRLIQADYMLATKTAEVTGNRVRISAGIVFCWRGAAR